NAQAKLREYHYMFNTGGEGTNIDSIPDHTTYSSGIRTQRFKLASVSRSINNFALNEVFLPTILLNDMGQLVGQQPLALSGCCIEFPCIKVYIFTYGKSMSIDTAGHLSGINITVYSYLAEISSYSRAHKVSGFLMKQCPTSPGSLNQMGRVII